MFIVHYHDEKDPEAVEVFAGPFALIEEAFAFAESMPDPIWLGLRVLEVLPVQDPFELGTFYAFTFAAHRRHLRMRAGERG